MKSMMSAAAITVLVTCLGCHRAQTDGVSAVSAASAVSGEPVEVIPFSLTDSNNIAIEATLNGHHSVRLMFHTGVGAVSLTRVAVERMSDLQFDGSENVQAWGGDQSIRFGEGNTIEIGEARWDDVAVFESELSGHGTDGKFGPNLFGNRVIEIDYDRSMLLTYDELPSVENFEKIELTTQGGLLFLDAGIEVGGKSYPSRFMVHSGFGGSLLLDEPFVEKNELGAQLETSSETEFRDSFGNIVKSRKVRIPALNVAGTTLSDVPAGLFPGQVGGQTMSVLGGELLKRFHIIIDRAGGAIYMKPSQQFDVAFNRSA